MKYLRDIICIARYLDKVYVYTIYGEKFLIDDVTVDGLVYLNHQWTLMFNHYDDLDMIKCYKICEELQEMINVLKKLPLNTCANNQLLKLS